MGKEATGNEYMHARKTRVVDASGMAGMVAQSVCLHASYQRPVVARRCNRLRGADNGVGYPRRLSVRLRRLPQRVPLGR